MTRRTPSGKSRPKARKTAHPEAAHPAPSAAPVAPVSSASASPEKLTPEEQMERFAKELKNEDWGHQPC